jgi:hypothetical protein
MGREKPRKGAGRDGEGFLALPHIVMDSPAFQALSYPARALLLEVGRQYKGGNNGRMLLSRAYLGKRGWKSADVISRAKAELLAAGFIHQTVLGYRPNKASWYACTWWSLDKLDGYDDWMATGFRRGAYANGTRLIPPHGTGAPAIGPPHGTEEASPVPPHGPVEAHSGAPPVPPHGHHLEEPSPAPRKGK